MPTSCSRLAAHSSARSSARRLERARGGERVVQLQREPGDVVGVADVGAAAERDVADRRRAHVGQQRLGAGEQPVLEEHALAQPGAGDLHRVEAAESKHRLEHERGAEHDVRPRGLDAGQRALRRPAAPASSSISSPSASRCRRAPWTAVTGDAGAPLRRGREVARGAAHADQVRAAGGEPAGVGELLADRRPRALEALARHRAVAGQQPLADAHRAERPRVPTPRSRRPSTRTSCRLPPPRSSATPSTSPVVLTAARWP